MFDSDKQCLIPRDLDRLAPGPALAQLLGCINLAELSGYDRIIVLRAQQRMISHYQAQAYDSMAAVSDALHDLDEDPQLAYAGAAAEIRVALTLTRRAADSELNLALDLRRRLPRIWELLESGRIDGRRARVIVDSTSHLSIASAREVVSQLVDIAPELTTGQLAARLRRLSLEANPSDARDRYQATVFNRRVVPQATPEGTAHLLGWNLPPHRVAAATRRINRIAHSLRTKREPRSIDQIRADVFLDLLTGPSSSGVADRGVVDIRVDLETLAELNDTPAELAGYGPVIADIARHVATHQANTEWRYAVTDNSGHILTNGTTRRRPTGTQRRRVQTLTETCIFPGCRMPATTCDLDHRTPHAEGGPTQTGNLAPLCGHDHRIKTNGWTHQPLPNDTHQWTTKLGHTYTTSGTPP